ncbi:MAG: type II toxin-antitoxin system ParD family antitoxin [Rhodospirillaceae bacterium]|jgi:antitoxin ParD1/3/4|nr:type II toxin-antitoxin system ParD family antitoxin [Rhodospirillales bacterium]MBT3905640.1 type II toxin-antitoxin system ParD family antitoxin [Rhodospirillaceae bacterium]MBT5036303.1 type II toxin-antitoxin system ParD family antitoxin [Rhodospirillaceae bacterium]MBT6219613.1 type II toxin-antitoxin system ParD family antitoxin [Rhodospirillaceae bacterium]MBT6363220.1 type II toxin-antitoxin system ParD family antitoxin [Rhodospirillaceae bacterium]
MPRQSISFTDPNAQWLKQKTDIEGEYKSNSELVNDLIRQKRRAETTEIEAIRAALIEGERSGISDQTPEEIRATVQERLRANGKLPAE